MGTLEEREIPPPSPAAHQGMTLRRPVGIIPTLPVEGAISPPLEARPRESTTEASRPHTSCIALIVACAVTAAFFAHRHERCRMPPVVERRPVNIERPELESVPQHFWPDD